MLITYNRSFNVKEGFSVLSWNVLAQGFYTPEKFPHVDMIPFKDRFRIIKQIIEGYNASILCLPQVDMAADFSQQLQSMGYLTYFNCVKKQTDKNTNQGIMMAVKFRQFIVVDYHHSFYKNYEESQYWSLELESIKNKNKLILLGTHMKSKVEFEEVRKLQAIQLVEHISILNKKDPSAAIVLVGDFNAEPTYESYKIISQHQLANGQILKSAYDIDDKEMWTTCKLRETLELRTIDYVLYKGLKLVAVEQPPNVTKIKQKGLPDRMMPSDHLPLFAVFSW